MNLILGRAQRKTFVKWAMSFPVQRASCPAEKMFPEPRSLPGVQPVMNNDEWRRTFQHG
jgi:hypothetical protein